MPDSRRVAGAASEMLASTAATVASACSRTRDRRPLGYTGSETGRWRISSHEPFTHDSIQHLGYDWSRIADPGIAPAPPLRVYLPRSVDGVVQILNETRAPGERLAIRSKGGHSSNDLVLAEQGVL